MACNRIIVGALAIVTGQVRQDIRTGGLIVGILGDFLKSSGSSILVRIWEKICPLRHYAHSVFSFACAHYVISFAPMTSNYLCMRFRWQAQIKHYTLELTKAEASTSVTEAEM